MKKKRALSQIQGPVRQRGDADVLARAWERASAKDPDFLTHGFHTWPARMHPAIARTVLSHSGAKTMVDPFCGGGTTLVEARVAGAEAVGVDLSPLAIRVADVKTQRRNREARGAFIKAARRVAANSEERVRGRVKIHVDLPKPVLEWWDGHVIKELGGLREEIGNVEGFEERRALAMVFSSILTKVSKQRSETDRAQASRRIRKGLSTELFLRRAKELARRWDDFEKVAKGPPPRLMEGDARGLQRLVGKRTFDLVLTSPPYGGTYDYADHHARRMAWLDLDDSNLRRFEVGARRRMNHANSRDVWEEEVDQMMRAMASVLSPDGAIVLVMGDGRAGGEIIRVPEQLQRILPQYDLELSGVASQERHAGREEHILLIRRSL